jgi:hypothetical protein
LEICASQGREPAGPVLDLVRKLASDYPPARKEEDLMRRICELERAVGLTIHQSVAVGSASTPAAASAPERRDLS